jgi:GNAT superfamily N-acetyltransferase
MSHANESNRLPITIRPATANDVDAIVHILIATKESSLAHSITNQDRDVALWIDRWHRYITRGSSAQFACGDSFTFLAEIEKQPIGFAAYHHTSRHGTDAELQSMYVMKTSQGQGVGTALLRLIASELTNDGSATMCVGYSPDNPYKRFYLKHGAAEINPHWAVWHDLRRVASID